MTLYVATTNAGKLRDFATAAATAAETFHFKPLPGLAAIPAPEEDQPTFTGNAELKALYYSRHAPGLVVLADDSGLEVDALNGAPGVHSARWAELAGWGDGADKDARNNSYLLAQLRTHEDRRARYRCVLAAARDGAVLGTGEGAVEGVILREPRGAGGFGYDPLFLVPEPLQCTMAELTAEQRLAISHRGAALRALLARLPASPLWRCDAVTPLPARTLTPRRAARIMKCGVVRERPQGDPMAAASAAPAPASATPADTGGKRHGVQPLRAGQGHSFLLRKLHSLSGIVPIGAFLIEHLVSNFEALKGPAAYAQQVKFLNGLPFVRVLEWAFIFLPLAYHALYGVYIWLRGKSNVVYYPWAGNWMYAAQRWTGGIALAYIVQHVWRQRFSGVSLPEHPGAAFHKVQVELMHPWMLAIYAVAMIATCWHFAYGVWLFAAKWGITPGDRARRNFGYVCGAVGIGLATIGLASMYAFVGPQYRNAPADLTPTQIEQGSLTPAPAGGQTPASN